jgi:hypothetical protein
MQNSTESCKQYRVTMLKASEKIHRRKKKIEGLRTNETEAMSSLAFMRLSGPWQKFEQRVVFDWTECVVRFVNLQKYQGLRQFMFHPERFHHSTFVRQKTQLIVDSSMNKTFDLFAN